MASECVSVNIGPPIGWNKIICELSNSDHFQYPGDVIRRPGWAYGATENLCSINKPCINNAKCLLGYTDKKYLCVCASGFTGENCEKDIDECNNGRHDCNGNATCINTAGHFNCTCNSGYSGDGHLCSDIDECSNDIHNCNENATCVNTAGHFNCTCNSGYSGDGHLCSDVDECAQNIHTCSANAVCNNTEGAFNCTCKPGFTGDGHNCAAPGVDCKNIKTRDVSPADGMYLLDLDGGSYSNAFLAYCDMTSYGGGWTMCYTTDEYADPEIEVTYDASLPYGTDGYRTNCNNIPFTEIIFIDHQTGNKAYFKRKSNQPVTATTNYWKSASTYGLWDGFGAMDSSYSYQLVICNGFRHSGFFVSGYTGNCYKQCYVWCSDRASPYFRTATLLPGRGGVAFNTNGHSPNVVNNRLMSVGLR